METALYLLPLRAGLAEQTEQVRQTIFAPDPGSSLQLDQRLSIALCVARRCESDQLVSIFSQQLDELLGPISTATVLDESSWDAGLSTAVVALLEYAVEVTVDPASSDQADIQRLQAAGLSDTQIVAASQVIAFVNYLARLLFVTQTLDHTEQNASADEQALQNIDRDFDGEALRHPREVFPIMNWEGGVSTVDLSTQSAAGAPKAPGSSDYYGVLGHEPRVLELRTILYDDIMTGEGKLPRADREFVALATSLRTGCEFCASVHGRRHFMLSKDTTSTPRLKAYGASSLEGPRHRALANFAQALAATPPVLNVRHLSALKSVGLDEEEIFDAAAVSSMFAWANRLMLTLGKGTA